MSDLWRTLEGRSSKWHAIRRQGLADAIWYHYVNARFRRTGDPRALEYLYSYLGQAATRHQAVRVACTVFEGRGMPALASLTYFTQNPDPFLRDRAVRLVGAALRGANADLVLETLRPYLRDANQFVRRQAVAVLGQAARGQALEAALQEMLAVAAMTPAIGTNLLLSSIALLYQGAPTETAYRHVVPEHDWKNDILEFPMDGEKAGVLVMGADKAWYERLCEEVIDPMLAPQDLPDEVGHGWMRPLRHRDAVEALFTAGAGRGMDPLRRMLGVRHGHSAVGRMLQVAPRCFVGADLEGCAEPLSELARDGDVPTQRVAAVCLGRLVMGQERADVIALLADLCVVRNGAVRAAAVRGLGLAARSLADDSLRRTCLRLAAQPETARVAIRALGHVYLGTGHTGVFGDIRDTAAALRERPVRGKRYDRPLAECYFAAGLVYAGTGSLEPMELLLDGVARPRESQHMAARGLVMTEFPESRLGNAFLGIDDYHPVEVDKARIAPEDW